MKNFIEGIKKAAKNVNEIITEEISGSGMTSFIKEKVKDIQVKVDEKINYFTTEEIDAIDNNTSLDITLVVSGLDKEKINVDVEGTKLQITIDDKEIPKAIRNTWSVSKNKLFYDFSQFEESARIEEISVKLNAGILLITIPKKERSKEKRKINIL